MCRMVGAVFRGRVPTRWLEELRSVSRDGRIPGLDQIGHRDGWGVAGFAGRRPQYLGRSSKWAAEDPSYDAMIDRASELETPGIIIGHVRAASRGDAKLANTHPFIVDGLVLAHNGTVKDFRPETKRKPAGETDSELIALLLADKYSEDNDLIASLRSVVRGEVLTRKYTGAVILATDGRTLCAYRNYSENGSYYDLRMAAGKDSVVFFQESTGPVAGPVSQVGRGELVSVDLDLRVKRESIL